MSGEAMGTEMGPSYACLFMGHLEHTLLKQNKKPVPEIYKRYIDGGTGTTSLSYNQLLDFINFVHNFHPAVKFTVRNFSKVRHFPEHDNLPETRNTHYIRSLQIN